MKKYIALLLALAMCLSLAACAQDNPYREYRDLFEMLEHQDYDDAIAYIEDLRGTYSNDENRNEPVEDDDDDVPAFIETEPDQPVEQLTDEMLWTYENIISSLDYYESGEYIYLYDYSTDTDYQGMEAMAFACRFLTELGDYGEAAAYASRFTIVEDVYLGYIQVSVDNLSNRDENDYSDNYVYDAEGRLVRYYDSVENYKYGTYWDTFNYEYDAEGKVSAIKVGYSDNITKLITPTYDETGLLISEQINTDTGDEYTVTYTYDEQGNVTSWTRVAGDYTYQTTYTYDENGLLIREVYESFWYSDWDQQNELMDQYITDYVYDGSGHLAEKTRLIQDNYDDYNGRFYSTQTNHYSYTCDDQGRVLTEMLTYGNIIYSDSEDKPSYVSSETTHIYGDYYVFATEE